MPFQVFVEDPVVVFPCRDGESVLAAMGAAGARCVQVGCRGGGCGVCRVQVLAGRFDTGTMSSAQVNDADRSEGIVLACKLFPRSDLRLRALGRQSTGAPDTDAASLFRRLTSGIPNNCISTT